MSTDAELIPETEASQLLGLARGTLRSRRFRGKAPTHVTDANGRAWYTRAALQGHEGERQAGRPSKERVTAATRRDRWVREHGRASEHACSGCGWWEAQCWVEREPGTFRAFCTDCAAAHRDRW